jgi:F0F1-type ATP synthase epsilon subunit
MPAGPKEFADAWLKKAPSTLAVPELPSNFTNVSADSQTQGDLFPVNFYTPSSMIADGAKRDGVTLPGVDGMFGVKANHVPIIAQLRPGVVELSNGAETEKYFISGGFAFVHPNGVTDICALEAGTLDQFDPAAVRVPAGNGWAAADEAGSCTTLIWGFRDGWQLGSPLGSRNQPTAWQCARASRLAPNAPSWAAGWLSSQPWGPPSVAEHSILLGSRQRQLLSSTLAAPFLSSCCALSAPHSSCGAHASPRCTGEVGACGRHFLARPG